MKYTVTLELLSVKSVSVEAESFEEAERKAKDECINKHGDYAEDLSAIEICDENGKIERY